MAPSGQACDAVGAEQAPAQVEAEALPSMVMASVGHASAQARQPSGHLDASTTGRPRKRSGRAGTLRRVRDRPVALLQTGKRRLAA